jgi:hypothetical protein
MPSALNSLPFSARACLIALAAISLVGYAGWIIRHRSVHGQNPANEGIGHAQGLAYASEFLLLGLFGFCVACFVYFIMNDKATNPAGEDDDKYEGVSSIKGEWSLSAAISPKLLTWILSTHRSHFAFLLFGSSSRMPCWCGLYGCHA